MSTSSMSGWVRTPARVALGLMATIVLAATVASFTQSYRGLYWWAVRHGMTGFWAAAWPLQVDTFIIVGELLLFLVVAYGWGWQVRTAAWAATLLGLAVSVAGNVGHAATTDLATRATFAIPPLAAAAALFLGLITFKAATGHGHTDQPVATLVAREVAMVRSGERAYGAGLSASDRARDADTKRHEKADKECRERADKERTVRPPKRTRPPVTGRSKAATKDAGVAALVAQPDMTAEDLATQLGTSVSGRTVRRWRDDARKMATASNGHGPTA